MAFITNHKTKGRGRDQKKKETDIQREKANELKEMKVCQELHCVELISVLGAEGRCSERISFSHVKALHEFLIGAQL